MKVLVFNVIWFNLRSSISSTGYITHTYILVIDRTCSSLYEVGSIKKYLSCNSIRYIIQQRTFARRVPEKLLTDINNLFSMNFGTSEVISIIKKKLIPLFSKQIQKVGYIYEVDI